MGKLAFLLWGGIEAFAGETRQRRRNARTKADPSPLFAKGATRFGMTGAGLDAGIGEAAESSDQGKTSKEGKQHSQEWLCRKNEDDETQRKRTGGMPRMIVNMSRDATEEQIEHVIERIKECGYQAHVIRGAERTVIGAVGSGGRRGSWKRCKPRPASKSWCPSRSPSSWSAASCIASARSWTWAAWRSAASSWVVIAGPCSVESREQLLTTARGVRDAGASLLRGGAYKPRTSPYDFQGLGVEALEASEGSARRDRAADCHRSDEHRRRGPGVRIRRHAAGGRAQHAELSRCCGAWRR